MLNFIKILIETNNEKIINVKNNNTISLFNAKESNNGPLNAKNLEYFLSVLFNEPLLLVLNFPVN